MAELSDEELEAARAQGRDDTLLLEALEASGQTAYLPTEEEIAAAPPAVQGSITAPDAGSVFRTTTGRPPLAIAPYQDGSHPNHSH